MIFQGCRRGPDRTPSLKTSYDLCIVLISPEIPNWPLYSPRHPASGVQAVRGGRGTPPEAPCSPPRPPWRPLEEAPGGPLNGLEATGKPPPAWSNIYRPSLAYNIRDTRSFSHHSVARPQYAFRLLVKCLWTPEGFQAPNAIH